MQVEFSCSPRCTPTHWKQTVFVLSEPLDTEECKVKVTCSLAAHLSFSFCIPFPACACSEVLCTLHLPEWWRVLFSELLPMCLCCGIFVDVLCGEIYQYLWSIKSWKLEAADFHCRQWRFMSVLEAYMRFAVRFALVLPKVVPSCVLCHVILLSITNGGGIVFCVSFLIVCRWNNWGGADCEETEEASPCSARCAEADAAGYGRCCGEEALARLRHPIGACDDATCLCICDLPPIDSGSVQVLWALPMHVSAIEMNRHARHPLMRKSLYL